MVVKFDAVDPLGQSVSSAKIAGSEHVNSGGDHSPEGDNVSPLLNVSLDDILEKLKQYIPTPEEINQSFGGSFVEDFISELPEDSVESTIEYITVVTACSVVVIVVTGCSSLLPPCLSVSFVCATLRVAYTLVRS